MLCDYRGLASVMETDSINTETQINEYPKHEKSNDAQSTSSSRIVTEFRRKLRSFLPVNYKEEIIELLKLAGPVVSLFKLLCQKFKCTQCDLNQLFKYSVFYLICT